MVVKERDSRGDRKSLFKRVATVAFSSFIVTELLLLRRAGSSDGLAQLKRKRHYDMAVLNSTATMMLEVGSHTLHPYDTVLRETTRILYRDSPHLDQWLTTAPPIIYIYDTVTPEFSNIQNISTCVNYRFMRIGAEIMKERNICPWDPNDYCADNLKAESGPQNRFRHYRSNYNNDIALIRLFYNYPHQTTDPNEADFFVVPYPHKSHCLCTFPKKAKKHSCGYGIDGIKEHVIQKLEFYEQHKARHLFFLGVDFSMANRGFRREVSMSLSLGSVERCVGKVNESCGHFVIPYLTTAPEYAEPRTLEWFTDRPRNYSVGAAFGTPQPLHLRRQFITNQTVYLSDNVGGMPYQVLDFGKLRLFTSQADIVNLYNNSIFCPILPGDNCPQKRFFEVILNGCIPVVPRFNTSDEAGFPTFYKYDGFCSIRTAYPFIRGTFLNDLSTGIDYAKDLVVSFDGLCGLSCMKPAMEQVMANAAELHRLRSNLYTFTRFFRYGLGRDSLQGVDGFSAIIVGLRHYVMGLNESLPS